MSNVAINNQPPTAQNGTAPADEAAVEWLQLGQNAYAASTSYMDTNYRKAWEDSIRAFNSQHPAESKYNSPGYAKRSNLFRPKTRAVIRKNEAAAAAAFFSNMDVVSLEPVDKTSKVEAASADVMKHLLQYRLTKSIPWYLVVLGGLQDAQTTGVACAHIYWDYKERPQRAQTVETGQQDDQMTMGGAQVAAQPQKRPKPLIDKPCVDLLPVENLRIDPAANWMDPINTSPFVIHLIPMYVKDVKARMKSGEWIEFGDSTIRASMTNKFDSTRQARNTNRVDPMSDQVKAVTDYEICWVQRHIHERDGIDWEFYMLGDQALLTDPRPMDEVVFHGKRPYVMGCCIIETHKIYPTSVPQLGRGLQDEANEIANQRIDNVKFVLNKKWFVKRGRDADIGGLVRNVPGGVVMLEDPQTDVKEVSYQDVTSSAYEEQSRIDNDMNELVGNFSPAQVMMDGALNAPARNMALLGQSAGTLVEYLLRTYVETFVQPVLRQLVLLEQEYETDEVILGIAAKRAEVFQKFGVDQVTDDMLAQELTLSVNVGMGATDPQMKVQKFIAAMQSYLAMLQQAASAPGIDMAEVGKEIFGHLGYADGSRFFTGEDPKMAMMQKQVQELQAAIQQLETKLQAKAEDNLTKLTIAREGNMTEITKTQIQEDNENLRNTVTHLRAINEHEAQRVQQTNDAAKTQRAIQQRGMSEGYRG